MPDTVRAKILAKTLAWLIIALLYVLGALSLYLRSKYLEPTTATSTVESRIEEIKMEPTASKPILYPTMTPHLAETTEAKQSLLTYQQAQRANSQ